MINQRYLVRILVLVVEQIPISKDVGQQHVRVVDLGTWLALSKQVANVVFSRDRQSLRFAISNQWIRERERERDACMDGWMDG